MPPQDPNNQQNPVPQQPQQFPQPTPPPQTQQPQVPPAQPIPQPTGAPNPTTAGYYPTMSNNSQPAPRNSKKLIIIGAIIAAVVLLAGIVGAVLLMKQSSNPDAVFKKSLEVALSTSKLEQETALANASDDQNPLNQTIKYELSDPKNARATLLLKTGEIQIENYASFKNSYGRITSADDETIKFLKEFNPGIEINKWIQLRKDGQVTNQDAATIIELGDPRAAFLGHYILGNFSKEDRTKLYDFAINNQIYKYDTKQVKSETVNDESVYVYDVTIDSDKLKEYNKLAGNIFGLPESDFDTVVASTDLTSVKNAKLYISKKSKRLVKVVSKQDDNEVQVIYKNFESVDFPAEPSAN